MIVKKPLLEWLTDLENRHAQSIQMSLDRVQSMSKDLKCACFDAVVILVAGTNGKGSTIFALESIYRAAGYRVASYTSPHLLKFNERIRIDGLPVSDDRIADAFACVAEVDLKASLTYFEMTTLAAFCLFQQETLDIILLEVGLGGRLDATNIVHPDLSIITTIDLDHQAWLGETKEAIGLEKAGIMRSKCPVIYADVAPPASIIERAKVLNAPLYQYGIDYDLGLISKVSFQLKLHPKALASAVMAVQQLQKKLPVEWSKLKKPVVYYDLFGRQSLVFKNVMHVFDVAHNPQSAQELALFLQNQSIHGKIHMVFSAFKDKDILGLILPFRDLAQTWSVGLLPGARAATPSDFEAAFLKAKLSFLGCFDTPMKAYEQVNFFIKPEDWIVVYGSFLTVSGVYSLF